MYKEVTKTENSNIVNPEPIDAVITINRLATDKIWNMKRHKDVNYTISSANKSPTWTERVSFNEKCGNKKMKLFDILSEFEKMWDSHFGWMNKLEHVNQFPLLNVWFIYSNQFWADWELESSSNAKLAKCDEWASLRPCKQKGSTNCIWLQDICSSTLLRWLLKTEYRRPARHKTTPQDELMFRLPWRFYSSSTLDSNLGYWLVEVDEKDQDETRFN